MKQSAFDFNCNIFDFLDDRNVIVDYRLNKYAKKYYSEPISCSLVSYGNNIVASVKHIYRDIIKDYINKYDFYRCFEAPNLNLLNQKLTEHKQQVCVMAEYFLPDIEKLHALSCNYELKILEKPDFEHLYKPEWSNALCEDRKECDILGVGAYDSGKLIGLAGCSADCEEMWQIGVDVLPEYRQQKIASAITTTLAVEILKRGKVPFYCAAWSNIRSVRNAIKSGFMPTWVEMIVKPMNSYN